MRLTTTDHTAWQHTGELCDALVLAGLHRGNETNINTPFFLSELKRKIFVSTYGRDKIVASFLGRLPRLTRHYCKIELRLDLSDEELVLEGSELSEVIASLDCDGWNTAGALHRTTWLRMWFQHCRLREDILEIALGYGTEDPLLHAERIRAQLNQLHDACPDVMSAPLEDILKRGEARVEAADGSARKGSSAEFISIFAICIHAGNAYTEFLL